MSTPPVKPASPRVDQNPRSSPLAAFRSLTGILALLAFAFLWHPAAIRATVPCGNGPDFQEILRQGNDPDLAPLSRERAYERAIQLCPGRSDLYHSLSALLRQQRDFNGSERWSERGLRVAPEDPELKLDHAIALELTGRVADSVSALTRLPESATVEFYLGVAYDALQNHKAARQAFSRAVDLGYEDSYVFYALIEQDHALHDKEAGIKDFETFDQRFPDSPWLHMLLGDAYMTRYEDASAESEYQKALAKSPEIAGAHFRLGYLAFGRADYAGAAGEFRKEIGLDPAFGAPYLYLGLCLRRLGKDDEALPLLKKAVALNPDSPLPSRALAVVQIDTHDAKGALETLKAAKKRFPSEPAFSAQLATLLKQMGRPDEAEKEVALAESLGRKNNPPHLVSNPKPADQNESRPTGASAPAEGEARESHTRMATQQADANEPPPGGQAGETRPADNESKTLLADLRLCLARENAACATAALAALHDPRIEQGPEYPQLKAETLALQQQEAKALAPVRSAIQAHPAEPHYLITQGRIYEKFGDYLAAIESFLRAAQLEPKSPEPLYFTGMSFFLMAERVHSPEYFSRAEQNFKSALELSPDYDRAEFMLGVVAAMQSRLAEAQTYLRNTVQMKPSNPYYHLQYGILLKRMEDNRGALDEMHLAEKLYPSYALTHFELGSLYEKLQDYPQARKQLETAVELNPHLSTAYYHLGGVYLHLGLSDASKKALDRFQLAKAQEGEEVPDPAAMAISSAEITGGADVP